ncbi:hypothetical protein [Enterovirga rhinocerotis]|uniref:Uncharacterized protein n=1 Tax=Enterovirga rhinocerotis TaxID=1339210 RepID=A0A4R7BWS3_9HYPH|nr:hypothetical protein [Enterovirga rhinocerotis]TDR89953.1 hypothetical protein EV668_2790 [Enterovirga rhinocerotis]
MRIASTSALLLAALILPASVAPASADAGVRPVWEDFQPAVSTQYRAPDGGRRYPPPNNRLLIMNRDRQALPTSMPDLDRTVPRRTTRDPLLPPLTRPGAPLPPAGSTLPPPAPTIR